LPAALVLVFSLVCFWFGDVAALLFSWGVGLALIPPCSVGVAALLFACGVGLSLFSCRSICTAPVRGGTYFSLPAAKKSRQKKAGSNR
jgi:hypothetical protein